MCKWFFKNLFVVDVLNNVHTCQWITIESFHQKTTNIQKCPSTRSLFIPGKWGKKFVWVLKNVKVFNNLDRKFEYLLASFFNIITQVVLKNVHVRRNVQQHVLSYIYKLIWTKKPHKYKLLHTSSLSFILLPHICNKA